MEKLTRHHQIAQQHWGSWHPDNLMLLPRTEHSAVHLLFGNDPPLQIIRRVTEWVRSILDPQVYQMMNWVLVQVENVVEAYNPHCYNGTKLKEYLHNQQKLCK